MQPWLSPFLQDVQAVVQTRQINPPVPLAPLWLPANLPQVPLPTAMIKTHLALLPTSMVHPPLNALILDAATTLLLLEIQIAAQHIQTSA